MVLLAATCVAWVTPVVAAVDLSGGASVGVDYNSNAFDSSNREGSITDDTASRLSARVTAATVGGGPINAQLQAQYSQVDSFRNDSLDHNEYAYSGSLDWRPGQLFDASLAASHTRSPLSLADLGGERSVLQTSSQARATLRLRPTPRWQIGLSPAWSETKTPLPDARNFRLRENAASLSLDFLGAGPLVPGIIVSEAKGVNSGIANPTRYQTETVQGTLNYRVSGHSTLGLYVGYTQRDTTLALPSTDPVALANAGRDSGLSGTINYHRQLSVKTGITFNAFRTYEQYDTSLNPAVGTGFGVVVAWAPTVKLEVSLESQHTWTTVKGVQIGNTIGEREDLLRSYSLGVNYLATRRFSARVYVMRRIRNSGVSYADQFNGNSAGISLTATVD